MTKTQAVTLNRIAELATSGELDVTYGGIKGVNRAALWTLEGMGRVVVTRTYGHGTDHAPTKMVARVS